MKLDKLITSKKTLFFFFFVFAFFLSFFGLFHPPVMTTPDDWYYIAYTRDAIPLLDKHNPTRILPEVLMPVVSIISSVMIQPLCHDFVLSIAYGAALLLAILITFYAYNFFRLVRDRMKVSEGISLCITAFFLLFHFLIFRGARVDCQFLFSSFCLTNYYYYTIPILIIASFVMYCMRTGILDRLSSLSHFKLGIVLLVIYISLLSNLYSSIILVAYFLTFFIGKLHANKFQIAKSLKENKTVFGALLFYIVVLLFEANGGNARHLMAGNQSLFSQVWHTLAYYGSLRLQLNGWVAILCLILSLIALWCYWKDKDSLEKQKTARETVLFYLTNFIIVTLFCILISAKANPYYVSQSDKMFAEFFWLVLGVAICLAYCVKRIPKLTAVLPILFLLLFCHTNTKGKTFCDVYGYDRMPAVNDSLLNILHRADICDVDSLTLYVPVVENRADNWPFLTYVGPEFANTFHAHRLTSKRLNIDVVAVHGLQSITSSLDYNPQEVSASNDSIASPKEQ